MRHPATDLINPMYKGKDALGQFALTGPTKSDSPKKSLIPTTQLVQENLLSHEILWISFTVGPIKLLPQEMLDTSYVFGPGKMPQDNLSTTV